MKGICTSQVEMICFCWKNSNKYIQENRLPKVKKCRGNDSTSKHLEKSSFATGTVGIQNCTTEKYRIQTTRTLSVCDECSNSTRYNCRYSFGLTYAIFAVALISYKLVIDFLMLRKSTQFFKKRFPFFSFLASTFIYPIVTVLVVISSFRGNYVWKERSFKK